ncbi:MAG: hypothetical protein IJD51_05810 [Clostridia bacterium]|nr:hypothetical protein [Clostridia bacterium]
MIKNIIQKWYSALGFDRRLDSAFLALLEGELPTAELTAHNADLSGGEGEKTALILLYLLERMQDEYTARGIDSSVFDRLVSQIRTRIEGTYLEKGNFLVGDVSWFRLYLSCERFRIGRFYFDLIPSPADVPCKGLKKGDSIVALHVPAGEPLEYGYCVRSIEEAKSFIARHFPEYKYRYISCYSWLLDNSIADLVGTGSNILRFASLFEIVARHESDNIIRFVFQNGATREQLPDITPVGRFQTQLREEAMAGRIFYDCRGLIDITK